MGQILSCQFHQHNVESYSMGTLPLSHKHYNVNLNLGLLWLAWNSGKFADNIFKFIADLLEFHTISVLATSPTF